MTRVVLLLALVPLAACEERSRDKQPMDRETAAKLFDEVPLDVPPGMSDLTIDERGHLWAVAERDRTVVEIDIATRPATVVKHPLQGIADGVDTEAITWLGNNRFAIGAEGEAAPTATVVSAELRGNAVVATATRELSTAQVGVTLTINHGIEAVCGREGELLAAVESVGEVDGKRWAPLVRLRGDAVETAKLWLTTKTGKISALSCTIADDGTATVLAIERHFGVSRILSFTIARGATEVTPTLDLDLHPVLHDKFNVEGITRLPDGRLVTINDNQGRTVSGPTELFVFHPR